MYQYRIPDDDLGLESTEVESRGCRSRCDSGSAKALKRILSQIDELNSRDLRILSDIIERLLCSRS